MAPGGHLATLCQLSTNRGKARSMELVISSPDVVSGGQGSGRSLADRWGRCSWEGRRGGIVGRPRFRCCKVGVCRSLSGLVHGDDVVDLVAVRIPIEESGTRENGDHVELSGAEAGLLGQLPTCPPRATRQVRVHHQGGPTDRCRCEGSTGTHHPIRPARTPAPIMTRGRDPTTSRSSWM